MKNPIVSILILNWNGKTHIAQCLESVIKTTYSPIEIIVVDNASTDGSQDIIRQFPSVNLIQNTENTGYAAGNNIGFRNAGGKYIATLNNDVIVDPEWLDHPVLYMEKRGDIGITGCRQMQFFNQELTDVLFSYPDRSLILRPFDYGKKFGNHKHLRPGFVIGVNGASAIYRKEMIDKIGCFDERFFAYHEESDLCMRAFTNGWKCLYVPQSVVYHKGSQSFKQGSRTFFYYHERNRVWFIAKNYPLNFIIKNFLWILIMELRIARVIIFKAKIPSVYFKARLDAFKKMREFLDEGRTGKKSFKYAEKKYLRLRKEKIIYEDVIL
jgi:GT2 family glycosyltransferase